LLISIFSKFLGRVVLSIVHVVNQISFCPQVEHRKLSFYFALHVFLLGIVTKIIIVVILFTQTMCLF